jgi:outer membrane protein assembly factor BamA
MTKTFLYLLLLLGFVAVVEVRGQSKKDTTLGQQPHKEFALPTAPADSLYISKITIECNRRTIDRIIYRELYVKEKMRVKRSSLDSLLQRENYKLMNTKLFVMAEVVPYHTQTDTTELIVSLIEKWYTYPIPVFDFADRNFNEWAAKGYDLDRILYGINIVQQNFRGRNELLKFYFQLGFVRKVDFEYRVPYINKDQTLGLAFRFSYSNTKNVMYGLREALRQTHRNQDEAVLEERLFASVGLSKRSKYYNTHLIRLDYNYGHIHDSIRLLNSNYYANGRTTQRYFQLLYSFSRDLRDNAGFPLKGKLIEFEAMKKGLTGLDDLNYISFTGYYSYFMPLNKSFYYATSFRGHLSFPEQQPFSEMRGYGFNQNFTRGMEVYVVGGQHFGVWKNTLRFKALSTICNLKKVMRLDQFSTLPLAIFPKIYADLGYVHSNFDYGSNLFNKQVLWGTGIGLDMVLYNSNTFRFEYSMNSLLQTTFVFSFQADF